MIRIEYTVNVPHPMGAEVVERDRDWYVNERPPLTQIEEFEGEEIAETLQVKSIYADGKELDYLRQQFSNIPFPHHSHQTCIWRGDFAWFIFDNLTL